MFRVLATLIFLTSGVAHAQLRWNGPLPVQNERPFQSAFLHFEPRSPDVLSKGEWRFSSALHVANNLLIPAPSNSARIEEDFETQRLELVYARGLGRAWEARARTSLVARNGGALDGFISSYHRLLGLQGNGADVPAGRESLPRGRAVLSFEDASGNGISAGRAFGLGDTALEARRQLSRGQFTSALRLALKIPTGSDSKILGSGGADFGVGVDARHELGSRLSLFGNAGAFVYGNSSLPNASKAGVQAGLGLEFLAGRRDSFLAQLDAQSRTIRTGNAFADRTPVLASVGYKHRFGANRTLFASFSENGDYTNYNAPAFGNIGPDLTLSVGFEWRK